LSFLRSRLPSRRDVFLVFAVATVPIHLWALLNFLREVPGYILRAQLGFILAVLSYALVSCLIESLAVTGLVVLLAMITPRRFLLDRFVPQAMILVLIPAFWAIPIHYQSRIVNGLSLSVPVYIALVALWLITFFVGLVDLSIIIRRYPKVEAGFRDVADRLTVLASVFIVLDVLALGNVLARNWIL
jgi:hypothetical protein